MKKTFRIVLTAALAAAFAAPALAAPETFVSDPNHTFARFAYRHMGFSTQESRFDKVNATVVLDRAARTGSVEVTIDTRSVSTGSAMFNEHIQGEDFLDTAAYPTATFKSAKLNFKDDVLASIDGQLTLKGITKPVTLTVADFHCMPHPMMKKEACGADASATVKRTEFNMGKYAPGVSDEVTISVAIEGIKK
ncbi:MAG: YceI family protein [Proteobacteria bacterium]|nr:YceI family protein [Pseudomonadota bacterium]HQR04170.1 YceI family protein [Rhodocyclaceae bacterium]